MHLLLAQKGTISDGDEAIDLGQSPGDILFLSDVVAELDAAREAGMRTVLLDRREDYPEPRLADAANGHQRAESFGEIVP